MLFLVGAILTMVFTFKEKILSPIIEFVSERQQYDDKVSLDIPICLINNNFVTGNNTFEKDFILSDIEQGN